jgi:hypothetical protein
MAAVATRSYRTAPGAQPQPMVLVLAVFQLWADGQHPAARYVVGGASLQWNHDISLKLRLGCSCLQRRALCSRSVQAVPTCSCAAEGFALRQRSSDYRPSVATMGSTNPISLHFHAKLLWHSRDLAFKV